MRWFRSRLTLASLLLAGVALGAASPAGAQAAYLTPAERARVTALVEGDPRIRATLGDAQVHVEDVLPWSADGTRETLIGGGVTLEFDAPRTVEADWPLMDFPDGPDEYTITTVHYRVQDADAIEAWVDLSRNSVVTFDTRGGEVDETTVRAVTAAPDGARETLRDDPPAQRVTLLAGALVASLLAAGVVLGSRYGHVGLD